MLSLTLTETINFKLKAHLVSLQPWRYPPQRHWKVNQTKFGKILLCSSLDWSICDTDLKRIFDQMLSHSIITDKDRNGLSLDEWTADERSGNFLYEPLMESQEILSVWALKSWTHNTGEHCDLVGLCLAHLQQHEI